LAADTEAAACSAAALAIISIGESILLLSAGTNTVWIVACCWGALERLGLCADLPVDRPVIEADPETGPDAGPEACAELPIDLEAE
jgi:hypothetical protein